jgi:hypothetical protein
MTRSTIAIALCFCLWALIHSVLASLAVKRWAHHTFGARHERWYRLAFNAVAGLTLLPLLAMVLWLPDRTLYTIPFPSGGCRLRGSAWPSRPWCGPRCRRMSCASLASHSS